MTAPTASAASAARHFAQLEDPFFASFESVDETITYMAYEPQYGNILLFSLARLPPPEMSAQYIVRLPGNTPRSLPAARQRIEGDLAVSRPCDVLFLGERVVIIYSSHTSIFAVDVVTLAPCGIVKTPWLEAQFESEASKPQTTCSVVVTSGRLCLPVVHLRYHACPSFAQGIYASDLPESERDANCLFQSNEEGEGARTYVWHRQRPANSQSWSELIHGSRMLPERSRVKFTDVLYVLRPMVPDGSIGLVAPVPSRVHAQSEDRSHNDLEVRAMAGTGELVAGITEDAKRGARGLPQDESWRLVPECVITTTPYCVAYLCEHDDGRGTRQVAVTTMQLLHSDWREALRESTLPLPARFRSLARTLAVMRLHAHENEIAWGSLPPELFESVLTCLWAIEIFSAVKATKTRGLHYRMRCNSKAND